MAHYDFPLEELKKYKGNIKEPKDFDLFWKKSIEEQMSMYPLTTSYKPCKTYLTNLNVFDTEFSGYNGDTVKGWFIYPKGVEGKKLPCIIHFLGYGSGRGSAYRHLLYPSMGYALFVMDTRGQGSYSAPGDTADNYGAEPQVWGFLTKGITDKNNYYYKRLIIDTVRAVETLAQNEIVDKDKIITNGLSQGGALSIACSALSDKVFATMTDVPFLSDFKRSTSILDTEPYIEIVKYLKVHRTSVETVFNTLSYFDCVSFAKRCKSRAIFSVALMDTICPPSSVYAAYNNYKGKKEMHVYEYNNHEGGDSEHDIKKMEFLNSILK